MILITLSYIKRPYYLYLSLLVNSYCIRKVPLEFSALENHNLLGYSFLLPSKLLTFLFLASRKMLTRKRVVNSVPVSNGGSFQHVTTKYSASSF